MTGVAVDQVDAFPANFDTARLVFQLVHITPGVQGWFPVVYNSLEFRSHYCPPELSGITVRVSEVMDEEPILAGTPLASVR